MTIDWTQAPPWANYAAMDPDGCWFWYASEPKLQSVAWSPADSNFEIIDRPEWTQTLTQRPTT